MATCDFCKNKEQKNGKCVYCGNTYLGGEADVLFGMTHKEKVPCRFSITNKYLIIMGIGAGELLGKGAAFGAFGILGEALAEKAMKHDNVHGFYDLREIAKIIFPYQCPKIKHKRAMKIINADGTDFILDLTRSGMLTSTSQKVVTTLAALGVYVESGENRVFEQYCVRPFINGETLSLHVCNSAARFVQMKAGQFVAPPKAQPQVQPQARMPAKVFCAYCGKQQGSENKFCVYCGKPM